MFSRLLNKIKHIQAAAINSSVHAQSDDCYFSVVQGPYKLKKTWQTINDLEVILKEQEVYY